MINYYLLKARISFCNQTKSAAMLIQSFSHTFRLQAGQVTQHDKWHAWSGDTCLHTNVHPSGCFVTCFPSNVGGFVFFSHPLVLSRLPPFLFDTGVSLVSISTSYRCPWSIGQVSWFKFTTFTTSMLLQFHACILAKPTAWKRGCGGSVTAISPFSKKERCLLFFLQFWTECT